MIALTTFIGSLCYLAGLPSGRLFAACFALVGAASVPVIAFS